MKRGGVTMKRAAYMPAGCDVVLERNREEQIKLVSFEARAPACREGGMEVKVKVAARIDSASQRPWLTFTP